MKTVKEVKDYAMKNYEHGGDGIIECWSDKDIQQFLNDCKERGWNVKEQLDDIFSIRNEYFEAVRYFSGECYEETETNENNMEETTQENVEDEDTYDDCIDDPCYGCQACDHSYNCKHCIHGDDGNYESPFDVYTPSELGLSVRW